MVGRLLPATVRNFGRSSGRYVSGAAKQAKGAVRLAAELSTVTAVQWFLTRLVELVVGFCAGMVVYLALITPLFTILSQLLGDWLETVENPVFKWGLAWGYQVLALDYGVTLVVWFFSFDVCYLIWKVFVEPAVRVTRKS